MCSPEVCHPKDAEAIDLLGVGATFRRKQLTATLDVLAPYVREAYEEAALLEEEMAAANLRMLRYLHGGLLRASGQFDYRRARSIDVRYRDYLEFYVGFPVGAAVVAQEKRTATDVRKDANELLEGFSVVLQAQLDQPRFNRKRLN